MEFLNYKGIKIRQNKQGILYKKPNPRDISIQFYTLARELDDYKLHAGLCHLAVNTCYSKEGQVEPFLNAARAFSKGSNSVISIEDHVQTVKWVYREALLICDSSFMAPIYMELGRFYELHRMHIQAAECFKQSMSISRCVHNLILSKRYKRALEELKNSPSHLLSRKDHTTLFLLELLLNEDVGELDRLMNANQSNDRRKSDDQLLPMDDHLFDLCGLLESLLIYHKDKALHIHDAQNRIKIKNSIAERLCAFLDQPQIRLLYLILADIK